jgi:hypothetical protein
VPCSECLESIVDTLTEVLHCEGYFVSQASHFGISCRSGIRHGLLHSLNAAFSNAYLVLDLEASSSCTFASTCAVILQEFHTSRSATDFLLKVFHSRLQAL